MANGCFFNLGARLARYTGNETYAKQAVETWDWLTAIGFIDSETWAVYDGAHVENNCTDINKIQFSYPAALLAQGAAYMYNYVCCFFFTLFNPCPNSLHLIPGTSY